jgi:outer membrane protease
MKNIAFLSSLVIILFIFSAINPVNCEANDNYQFSIGTFFGIVYGQAFELVYPNPEITKGELLSELRWDMKPVYYLGLNLDFGRINKMTSVGFYTSIAFKAGIPGDSGVHENRDWMSTENSNLTHFSSHTNRTRELFWLDALAGVSIPVKSYFYIKPFISGSWMHFAYSGMNGRGIYARKEVCSVYCTLPHQSGSSCPGRGPPDFTKYHPIDSADFPYYNYPDGYSFTGEVIRYQQDWLLIAAGISIGTNFFYPFVFNFSFQISPFTYCAARDDHLTRNVTFLDFTGWGLFYEPKGKISFYIKNIDFSLEGAYRIIGRTTGPSYNDDGTPGIFRSGGLAGAALSLIDIRFLVRYRF